MSSAHHRVSDSAVPSVPLHSPDGAKAHSAGHGHARSFPDRLFLPLTFAFYTLIMVLFSISVRYGDVEGERLSDGMQVVKYYGMFVHVSIMIFIGFGYLMTFLKRFGYNALGMTLLLSVLAWLWNVLCKGFWDNVYEQSEDWRVHLNFDIMVEGLFGAGAVMISFGAVIGRAAPSQLIVMTFIEIMMYSLNFYIGVHVLKVSDAGGSMIIHTFGAYFGLSAAMAFEHVRRKRLPEVAYEGNGARTTSDLTAMIGTIFLWIMWPSFNAVLTSDGQRMRALANTFVSLCGAVVASFFVSAMLKKKLDMVHIQNSTLAGGVAIGACADLYTEPAGALAIGTFAGILSVFGYVYLTPFLQRKIGLYDTCGIHNLHGMPGVLSALCSAIIVRASKSVDYGAGEFQDKFSRYTPTHQADRQIYTLLVTLGIAIVTGTITGAIMKLMPSGESIYEDSEVWEVQPDYESLRPARSVHTPSAPYVSTAAPVVERSEDAAHKSFAHSGMNLRVTAGSPGSYNAGDIELSNVSPNPAMERPVGMQVKTGADASFTVC